MKETELSTVLYAASEPHFADLIQESVSRMGLRLRVAKAGAEVPSLSELMPTAIVLESLLSGPYFEVCRQLKAVPEATRSIPIVLLARHPHADENFALFAERPPEEVIAADDVESKFANVLRKIVVRHHRQSMFRRGIFSAVSLLDQLNAGIALLDRSARIVYHNSRFLELVQSSSQDALGRVAWEVLSSPTPPKLVTKEGFLRALSEAAKWEWQTGRIWLEGRCKTLVSARNAAEGWLLEVRDIGVEKEALEDQRKDGLSKIENLKREIQALRNDQVTGSEQNHGGNFPTLYPETFRQLCEEYGRHLDQSLEAKGFRIEYNRVQALRMIAAQLGDLHASPRDVIELHTVALRSKLATADTVRGAAYADEARLTVLELMGYLADYYRASNTSNASRPSTPPLQERDRYV